MKYLYTVALIALSFFSKAQIIKTVAGTGTVTCSAGGGLATAVSVGILSSIAVDTSGNVYIGAPNCHMVKKISAWGTITTIVGTGVEGNSGDGGLATHAAIGLPTGLAADKAGNLYISDSYNNLVRKVTPAGIISKVAGTAVIGGGYSGDGGAASAAALDNPQGIAIDTAGNLYIADAGNYRIRKVAATGIITTIAGTGVYGYSGDGGAALSAQLQDVKGIAADHYGNIYFADADRVRKIDAGGTITSIAGNSTPGYSGDGGAATAATLDDPQGIFADNYGNIFIADKHNNVVRRIGANDTITNFAGDNVAGHSGDGGPATDARLRVPQGVAVDKNGAVYIAEMDGAYVRRVDTCLAPAVGTITGDSMICNEASALFTDPEPGGTWAVSDPAVATISSSGTVTALANGAVTILYAVANSCTTAYAFKAIRVGPYAGTIDGMDAYRYGEVDTFCYYGEVRNVGGDTGGVWGVTDTNSNTISASGHITPRVYGLDTAFYVVTNSCGSDTAFLPFIIIWCPDAVNRVPADEHDIAIYPNPAYDELTITSGTPVTDVAIINPVGQVVCSHKYSSKNVTMNIADLTPGIYLLRINGSEVRKFLKL